MRETERKGFYSGGRRKYKCKYVTIRDSRTREDLKHLEIKFDPSSEGRVWLGVLRFASENKFNANGEKYGQQTSTIKRAIRHAHSYPGGGYGTFGGYDIILFEMNTPFNTDIFACLPSPKFQDTNIKEGYLAGYGLYLRDEGNTCQTNEHGRTKHHYCQGVELETKVIRRFTNNSQSRRRPLLGPSPG